MKHLAIAALLLVGFALRADALPVDIAIVGPDKTPVAGAQIELNDFTKSGTTLEQSDANGHLQADLTPIEDGRFGSMTVRAPGYGLVYVEINGAQTQVQLGREKLLAGEVRDAKGQPVEGARVRISDVEVNRSRFRMPDVFADAFSARTQSDGSWTIGGLPADGTAYAIVDDPAYAYSIVEARLGANAISEAPPLAATAGASIAGRVLDEAGNGVAGVEVSTSRVVRELTSWHNMDAQTDAQGYYRIDSLPAGETYTVVVNDSKGRVAKAQQKLEVRAGQTLKDRNFQLQAALHIEGTITDAQTGAPLAGLSVTNYGPNAPDLPTDRPGTTDEKGRYSVVAMPGTNRVYISETEWPRVHFARNAAVEVQPKQNKTLDFALQKGVTLSGTTVNAAGKPLPNVFLFINVKSKLVGPDQDAAGGLGVTADDQGRWEIAGLPPGEVTIQPSAEWEIVAPPGELPIVVENQDGKVTFSAFQIKIEVPRAAPLVVPVRATGFKE